MSQFIKSPYAGKLKVINLWAGPGAGKSTTAAALFNLMKRERFEVELVTEVAKELTYEKSYAKLSNQLLVLAKQENRLRRLIGQCEYAVVDSPFPLSLVYASPEWADRLYGVVSATWDDYDNFNFYLKRTNRPFQRYGRKETLEEAQALDRRIAETYIEFNDGEEPNRNFPMADPDDPAVEYLVLDYVLKAQGLPTVAAKYGEDRVV